MRFKNFGKMLLTMGLSMFLAMAAAACGDDETPDNGGNNGGTNTDINGGGGNNNGGNNDSEEGGNTGTLTPSTPSNPNTADATLSRKPHQVGELTGLVIKTTSLHDCIQTLHL